MLTLSKVDRQPKVIYLGLLGSSKILLFLVEWHHTILWNFCQIRGSIHPSQFQDFSKLLLKWVMEWQHLFVNTFSLFWIDFQAFNIFPLFHNDFLEKISFPIWRERYIVNGIVDNSYFFLTLLNFLQNFVLLLFDGLVIFNFGS